MLIEAVHRLRCLFADRERTPSARRSAAAVPLGVVPGVRDGGKFAAVLPVLRGEDRVHGGSTDLDLWPASLTEEQLAAEWLATGEPALRDQLYAVCGSQDRATAIALDVRARAQREAEAEQMMLRVFGEARSGVVR